jgi:hypothetical protein
VLLFLALPTFFLTLLAFGNVLNSAAEAYDPALMPRALKISKSMTLHPADLAVSPPNPVLMVEIRLLIGRIERRLAVCPKPFRVVGMHALHELLDRYFVSGHVENSLKAPVPRANAADRIVLHHPSRVASKASCRRSLLACKSCSAACRLAAAPRSSAISVSTSATGVPLGGSGPPFPKAIAARAAAPTERAIIGSRLRAQ